MWKILLIEAAVIAVLILLLVIVSKTLSSLKKENKRLEGELEQAKTNIAYLYRNAKEIAKIEKDEKKFSEEIKNAKTDEEIFNVVNAVIAANNNRVRK
jgi:predicted Holliday junction resolvase-like endonuclease